MAKVIFAIIVLAMLIGGCTTTNNTQTPEKQKPSDFIKADSFILDVDSENLENTIEINVVIRNEGLFEGKTIMVVMYNCKNSQGALQGGLGIKADNQQIPTGEAKAFKAIFSADQSVPNGQYSCELFASATSGESVSSMLTFEIV